MLYQLEDEDDSDLLQPETLEQQLKDNGEVHQLDQQVLHITYLLMQCMALVVRLPFVLEHK